MGGAVLEARGQLGCGGTTRTRQHGDHFVNVRVDEVLGVVDSARVRESATLKLRLLGEPALPYLEKARKSNDLEVVRRAGGLRAQILQVAAIRRKDLLSKDLLRHLRPTFAFIPKAEKRAGHRVDVIRVQLAGGDQAAARHLVQLLGPQWYNIRLAVHGKQVVVLFGSEVELLESTLKNLAQNKPGLAAAKGLAAFQKNSHPARHIEFHASMERMLALLDRTPAPPMKALALTSFALTVGPDSLHMDVWVPSADIRVIAHKNRWW